MKSKTKAVIAAVGIGGLVGLGILASNIAPVPGSSKTISISASSLGGQAPLVDTISGKVLDSSGNGVPSLPVNLFVGLGTAPQVLVQTMTTTNTGDYSFNYTFEANGSYSVDVSDSVNNN